MKDYIEYIFGAILAAIGGAWAVFNKAASVYKEIDNRIDALEKDTITQQELQSALQTMEERQDKKFDRLDAKLDKVLLHVVNRND